MENKIKAAFEALGLQLKKGAETIYEFQYEGSTMLWLQSDDKNFLNIARPSIHPSDIPDELTLLRTVDKFNSKIKYIKATNSGGAIWLYYERELMEDEDLYAIIRAMVCHIDFSKVALASIFKRICDGEDVDEDEDDDNDDDDGISPESSNEGEDINVDDSDNPDIERLMKEFERSLDETDDYELIEDDDEEDGDYELLKDENEDDEA